MLKGWKRVTESEENKYRLATVHLLSELNYKPVSCNNQLIYTLLRIIFFDKQKQYC